ncbi:acyl transferase/acyl hydrolase/lysophospholipase [Flagelloscypha sp. PMI_526]|nr:acyl transferase/acyl hydrolase/lysophospholipase [Flagelloscypha sp. PMI_526]
MSYWVKDAEILDGEQILQIGVTPAFVMLKEVMGRISFDQNKHENEILPCDYFDLIVGSGDGGWLALMLGRLRMSVSRALDSYESIRAAVHGGEATSASIDETVMSTIEAITAKTDKFRIQILDLIASESDTPQSEKELLFDPTKPRPRCLTAVITQSAGHIAHPIILRTYKHRDNPTPNCPLWIAIRACTAVPNAFTPITIEDMSLVSASHLGHNNPITWALQEAKVQFPDAELSCVASLGSGHPGPFSLQPSDTSAPMNAAMHLARDSEEKAHEIAQLFHDQGRSGVYFRLSVEQGLQHYYYNQGFEKCEAKLHTRQYLLQPDINQRVNTLARLLKSSQHYGRDYSAGFIPDQSSQRGLSSTNKSPVLLAGPSVGSLPPLSWPSPSFPSCAPFPPSPRPSIFPWFWPARQYPNTFKFEPVDTKSFWSYGGHENVRDLSKPAMKAKGTTTAPPQPGAGPASPSLAPISQEAGTKSHDTKLPKNKPPGSTFWGKSESYQKETPSSSRHILCLVHRASMNVVCLLHPFLKRQYPQLPAQKAKSHNLTPQFKAQ